MAVGLDKALLPVCHTTTAWGRVTFDMPRQLCHGQFMAMAHRIHLTRRVVSSRSSTSLVDCCPWSSDCVLRVPYVAHSKLCLRLMLKMKIFEAGFSRKSIGCIVTEALCIFVL